MTCSTDRAKSWDYKGCMSKQAQMEHGCRHGSSSTEGEEEALL